MDIAIPVYDGLTALDAIGPYEVLSRLPGARVHFVAAEAGAKRTDTGMLGLTADSRLDELPSPDVIVVPGGPAAQSHTGDEQLVGWIRSAHERSEWTTSVCTGSLLLGAAGVLEGLEATTHWLVLDRLADFGARPVERRVVEQGKVVTAAGVSSGIDMALTLARRIAGDDAAQAIQLLLEYEPEPPFHSGSLRSAPDEIVELVRRGTGADPLPSGGSGGAR